MEYSVLPKDTSPMTCGEDDNNKNNIKGLEWEKGIKWWESREQGDKEMVRRRKKTTLKMLKSYVFLKKQNQLDYAAKLMYMKTSDLLMHIAGLCVT